MNLHWTYFKICTEFLLCVRGLKKIEGDDATPKGTFSLGKIYYRKYRIKNIQSKLSKKKIIRGMGWCHNINSKKYNQEIKFLNYFKLDFLASFFINKYTLRILYFLLLKSSNVIRIHNKIIELFIASYVLGCPYNFLWFSYKLL